MPRWCYRVMEAIFFRPSSPPSRWSRSRAGDGHSQQLDDDGAVDIGLEWTGRKTVAMEKAEPLMAFIRPRMPVWLSIYCFREAPSI